MSKHLLKDLVITKVALVDEGSCSEAHIQLYKRKPEGGTENMAEETKKVDTTGPMEDDKKKTDMMEEDKKRMEAELAKAKEENIRLAEELAELKKAKPAEVNTEEEILKGLDPAVKAIIEKSRLQAQAAEEAVKKMKEEQDRVESIAKAREFKEIPVAEEKLADVIRKAKSANILDEVDEILKAAQSAIEKSATFTTIGSDRDVDITKSKDEAWGKIEAKAEEIAKARNITKEAATQVVMSEHYDMYKEYLDTIRA